MLFDGLTQNLVLAELDDDVAAVWRTVLNGKAQMLATRIGEFDLTHESVAEVLGARPRTLLDRAFATIVRNRVQRGGILAPGASLMKEGENGRGLRSRWYAATLQKRIRDIHRLRQRIDFVHGDGLELLTSAADQEDAAFFIDPPYTVAGRRLYHHSALDHEELFARVARVKGDFMMTYDDAEPIRLLAERHDFDTLRLPMKNTHHRIMYELIIGRDLGWARSEA